MKRLKNNEGFTLVELMIVLSIIAILAVVLVPKVGEMKDSVRNQGVQSNVSNIRAYLELHINDKELATANGASNLVDSLNVDFTNTNKIVNPFNQSSTIAVVANAVNSDRSVVVGYVNGTAPTSASSDVDARKGQVLVTIYTDAYGVSGFKDDGTQFSYQVVK